MTQFPHCKSLTNRTDLQTETHELHTSCYLLDRLDEFQNSFLQRPESTKVNKCKSFNKYANDELMNVIALSMVDQHGEACECLCLHCTRVQLRANIEMRSQSKQKAHFN